MGTHADNLGKPVSLLQNVDKSDEISGGAFYLHLVSFPPCHSACAGCPDLSETITCNGPSFDKDSGNDGDSLRETEAIKQPFLILSP